MGKKADKIAKAAKKAKAAEKEIADLVAESGADGVSTHVKKGSDVKKAKDVKKGKGTPQSDKRTLDKVARARAEVASIVEVLESSAPVTTAVDPDAFEAELRVGDGFRLADRETDATPAFDGDKAAAEVVMERAADELAELQERLYAESRAGEGRSVLLVIQGMDTSGKGGIMRHVVGQLDPQGVAITAFKQPTPEERRHPFLWRIRKGLPEPGMIGVFDRSHYEDVLVVRVEGLVPASTWRRRYSQIRTFENSVTSGGTTVVKVMLHVGRDEQKARLGERLARPDKHWKYNPGDIDVRTKWDAYQEAYEEALIKTSTEVAPWYVVPADRKWYARLAVQQLLLGALRRIDPQWPAADFDVQVEQARLAES